LVVAAAAVEVARVAAHRAWVVRVAALVVAAAARGAAPPP